MVMLFRQRSAYSGCHRGIGVTQLSYTIVISTARIAAKERRATCQCYCQIGLSIILPAVLNGCQIAPYLNLRVCRTYSARPKPQLYVVAAYCVYLLTADAHYYV